MTKKVLIVEDDKMLCTIFQMFIQELGYELIGTVHTGLDAINAVKSCRDIDIILMDIHLDGLIDGVETAKQMEGVYNIPIIFVTGDDSPSTIVNATLSNVYGFIIKPLYKRNLGITIEYACAKFNKNNPQVENQ